MEILEETQDNLKFQERLGPIGNSRRDSAQLKLPGETRDDWKFQERRGPIENFREESEQFNSAKNLCEHAASTIKRN